MIKFKCGNCNHRIGAPDKYAGKRVRCPKCGAAITVSEPAPKPDAQKAPIIKFRCPKCNQKIGVKPDHAGKRVRCAKCKSPLIVPQAPAKPPPASEKDTTAVLRAGQEDRAPPSKLWEGLEGMDELLAVEAEAPALELQPQPRTVDERVSDTELTALIGGHPLGEGGAPSGRSRKIMSIVLVGLVVATCVYGVAVGAMVAKDVLAGQTSKEAVPEARVQEAQAFAEDYLRSLANPDIDKAHALLSAELQNEVEKEQLEEFAERVTDGDMTEPVLSMKHAEEDAEGIKFYLLYNLIRGQDFRAVIVVVQETEQGFQIGGIATSGFPAGTSSLGSRSYQELLEPLVTTAASRFGAMSSVFAKYFWPLRVLQFLVYLVSAVAWWIVFQKAGRPGWAAIVPFYNMWVLAQVGDRPGWMGLAACFCWCVPCAGPFIALVLMAMISFGVAGEFGRGIGFGIGLLLLPIVFYPILALSRD